MITAHGNLGSFIYEDRGLDSLIERPLPSLNLDRSNFQDKITDYEEGCHREEKEFDQHERTRKEKFHKYIKKKREKLKDEIQAFEETYDPFEVLGLPKGDYNISNIRKAYKKMALKYHPDRAGDKYAHQFQVITQSYIYLLKRAEEKEDKKCSVIDRTTPKVGSLIVEDVTTTTLSTGTRKKKMEISRKIQDREEQVAELRGGRNPRIEEINEDEDHRPEVLDARDGRFDLSRFNQMFEKMKMKDEHEDGYGDLLKRGANEGEEDHSTVFNKNMNREIFNAHFDNLKSRKAQSQSRRHVLPDAVDSSNFVSCAQIGSANGDFSIGKYSDIKKAHYEENMLIDPSTVNRREYRNVDDLEAERSRISYAPDEETKQVYDQYDNSLQEYERQRQEYVSRRDGDLRRHHQQVSRKISVRSAKQADDE